MHQKGRSRMIVDGILSQSGRSEGIEVQKSTAQSGRVQVDEKKIVKLAVKKLENVKVKK